MGCPFTTASSYEGRSEKDREASQFKVIPQQLALTFLVADTKAYVMGNNGASEVTMVTTESGGSGGLQFIERVVSGALQITAIDAYGDAVHSRHTVLGGVLRPSQYYGTCRKL